MPVMLLHDSPQNDFVLFKSAYVHFIRETSKLMLTFPVDKLDYVVLLYIFKGQSSFCAAL